MILCNCRFVLVTCLVVLGNVTAVSLHSAANENLTCPDAPRFGALHIVSGGDERPWSRAVRANHEQFAQRNGHVYTFYAGNEAYPRQPYWTKIKVLLDKIDQKGSKRPCEWILWVDDDVVFTDLDSDMLQRWQEWLFRKAKHISVTEDAASYARLNTGMILIRTTWTARRVLEELWKHGDGYLGHCNQNKCLHEQEALDTMYTYGQYLDGRTCRDAILVVPQRDHSMSFNMNTFRRFSHYNVFRSRHEDYSADGPGTRWLPGDFTCHVTGMAPTIRASLIQDCLRHAQKTIPFDKEDWLRLKAMR